MLKCAQQALVLYAGGARLELYDCVLRRCGKHPNKSAVLAECGSLIMRRCTLENHDAEAIVLQAAVCGKLRVADVAELNPSFDIDNRTARVAARIIAGLVTRRLGTRR